MCLGFFDFVFYTFVFLRYRTERRIMFDSWINIYYKRTKPSPESVVGFGFQHSTCLLKNILIYFKLCLVIQWTVMSINVSDEI